MQPVKMIVSLPSPPFGRGKQALNWEEQRVYTGLSDQPKNMLGTVPGRILRLTGFDSDVTAFTRTLEKVHSLRAAHHAVLQYGQNLWQKAQKHARKGNPDDRPLYWTRLAMTGALRRWRPSFSLSTTQWEKLLKILEASSRGATSTYFSMSQNTKKILITGFDPFGFDAHNDPADPCLRRSNPSGVAVLALTGRIVTFVSGGKKIAGEIRGSIFPVRFSDFDSGKTESYIRPFLREKSRVDMILTISQSGNSAFTFEHFAGRNRSSVSMDNLGAHGGGTKLQPSPGKNLEPGPEFLRSSLPIEEIRTGIHAGTDSTFPLVHNTAFTCMPPAPKTIGFPPYTAKAVEGSGGGYLSNEIFYRVALLREKENPDTPTGHLHVPLFEVPPRGALHSPDLARKQKQTVRHIRRILREALPYI